MPSLQYRYLLHENGPALWPEHKPLAEILEIQATTPPIIWESTYQGNPKAGAGSLFEREWFRDNRFNLPLHPGDFQSECVARWISYDTAFKDTTTSAFTARTVIELRPDYRARVMSVWRDRITMPRLLDQMKKDIANFNYDGKLWGCIIEDKASGTSAYQTLLDEGDDKVREILVAFNPGTDKITRAGQAAVWCKNGSVLLPAPSDQCPWLAVFEAELFSVPNASYMDQCDAFSQAVLWIEHLLAEGFHERIKKQAEM